MTHSHVIPRRPVRSVLQDAALASALGDRTLNPPTTPSSRLEYNMTDAKDWLPLSVTPLKEEEYATCHRGLRAVRRDLLRCVNLHSAAWVLRKS